MMIRLQAPAKLNLFLRVLGKRPDGYHELETLFERIDLSDELTFRPQPQGITVTCDDLSLDCGPTNLVTKAATLLQQTCGVFQGAAIHLVKRIPVAAGLGGGSSDAATALIGLNRLWTLGLSRKPLQDLAARLGSDVAFFLEEAPYAIGRGRGELCEPLNGTPLALWHVVVVPPARLSTKEVYDGFEVSRGLTGATPSITMVVHALRNGSLRELAEGLSNDLQPEAIRRCPVIDEIQRHLGAAGCLGTMVSGSGPSVFGLCHDQPHAERAAQHLRKDGHASWRVVVVNTLGREGDDDTL